MASHPTLFHEVQQFVYDHCPQLHYKKQLLEVVATWERAYQKRIAELESAIAPPPTMKLVNSAGNIKDCYCDDKDLRGGACSYCEAKDLEYLDSRGNRDDTYD